MGLLHLLLQLLGQRLHRAQPHRLALTLRVRLVMQLCDLKITHVGAAQPEHSGSPVVLACNIHRQR